MKELDRLSERLRDPVRIFCGVDQREMVGFSVFASSVIRRSSVPVQITPVSHDVLGMADRGDSSTQFNYSRFLVPYLCGFKGHALWMDGADMLIQADVAELWAMRDHQTPVKVVHHPEYQPAQSKFLNQLNPPYPRKNWSSVILYWCDHAYTRRLTPSFIASRTGAQLHRFEWIDKDKWIGDLPPEWNVLVGEPTARPENPKLLHYTLGIPAFPGYSGSEYADEWWSEYRAMQTPISERPGAMDEPPDTPALVRRPRGRPRKVAA